MGVRTSKDLENDLSNLSIPKFIFLFITLNVVFISLIILAINLI
ncbi:DUF2970 domain-containing protein [Gammaproteobacteria bacterium]|nr:DUF2970 domain-containing protein [Gammaproteobacteria bacterium]MDC0440530.1 DUF2970 domain-containing protein [Gammaproteobacteria bacterium]MDC0884355.1 DUF2970 domain-containing protein [Gammaproteobacteria bacterium]